MKRCPITYEIIEEGKYSKKGLQRLSTKLSDLNDFPYSPKEQIALAQNLATKLSIQGIQPKLSVKLNVNLENFEIVDQFGTYIIKPPHHVYEEIPQNEDLTMKLAEVVLIDVPFHGLIYNKDQSLSYFIRRFDRVGKKNKIPVEDFSQLMGFDRDAKYNTSIEKAIDVIHKFCSFPVLEKRNFFKSIIFNFLIGNEDMHLKNYSLITMDGVTKLSPAYDFLNTTIVLKTSEEIALSLNGKKSNLKKEDLIDYLGKNRLGLSEQDIQSELKIFTGAFDRWNDLIDKSFLSENKKLLYKKVFQERQKRLFV